MRYDPDRVVITEQPLRNIAALADVASKSSDAHVRAQLLGAIFENLSHAENMSSEQVQQLKQLYYEFNQYSVDLLTERV